MIGCDETFFQKQPLHNTTENIEASKYMENNFQRAQSM